MMPARDAILRRYSFLVLLVLAVVGCGRDSISPQPILTVSLHEVGGAVVEGRRSIHGRVVPADLTRVAFRIPGRISELSVQSGDAVKQGRVVARIENAIQEQRLLDARAQYQLSRRQLKRAEDLFELGSLSAAQRDELQAAFRLAKANLKLAEARQSYTAVVAPFDGTVVDVEKELFESVAPGETVLSLYRNDRTDVLVNVSDEVIAGMHQARDNAAFDTRAQFADGGRHYPMDYLKHSSARNPQTQAFQFWLSTHDPAARFPPGTPVTLTADFGQAGFALPSGLSVPLTALQANDDTSGFRVWRYRDGTVQPVAVRIGEVAAHGALVTEGLQAGDRVVISRLSRLSPGLAVRVSETVEDGPL
jgi:RND family efflux transporter MFP subunit